MWAVILEFNDNSCAPPDHIEIGGYQVIEDAERSAVEFLCNDYHGDPVDRAWVAREVCA